MVRAGIYDDGAYLVFILERLMERLKNKASCALASSKARFCSVIKSKSLAMFIEESEMC